MEKYLVHYFDYEVGNKRYVIWTQSRNANDQKKSTMYEAPTNNMYVTKLVGYSWCSFCYEFSGI